MNVIKYDFMGAPPLLSPSPFLNTMCTSLYTSLLSSIAVMAMLSPNALNFTTTRSKKKMVKYDGQLFLLTFARRF